MMWAMKIGKRFQLTFASFFIHSIDFSQDEPDDGSDEKDTDDTNADASDENDVSQENR